jgi:hypothetical protein
MGDSNEINLEGLWNALLSRQPAQVRSAFERLSKDEQHSVHTHLQRMSEEPGWHPEQRASARAALAALLDLRG